MTDGKYNTYSHFIRQILADAKHKKKLLHMATAQFLKEESVTSYLGRNPLARAALRLALIPFLLMERIPAADTFKVIQLSSSGI